MARKSLGERERAEHKADGSELRETVKSIEGLFVVRKTRSIELVVDEIGGSFEVGALAQNLPSDGNFSDRF